jgi:hypothetical protein
MTMNFFSRGRAGKLEELIKFLIIYVHIFI